mgnify:CR=1 FL=1
MARIESGKSQLDLRAHRIPDALEDVKCIFAADVNKKGLKLEVSWDVQNEIAFFDALKMKQIELNVLGNAVKYTPPGAASAILSGSWARRRMAGRPIGAR